MLQLGVLGPLEVVRDGVPLAVPARRQRALLTRLAMAPGRVVPATELVAAVWEDRPPDRATHALQVHVWRLRALLGPAAGALVTRAPGYLLDVPPEAVDAERFERDVRLAAGAEPAVAVDLLDRALRRWRGPAYAEFADGFARAAAVRLDELRTVARERYAAALLACGATDRAIAELTDLTTEHPLREGPHAELMRALHLAGRQPEALEVYRRFRERLAAELGLDPSARLQDLHARLLRGEAPPPTGAQPRDGSPRPAATTVDREAEATVDPEGATTVDREAAATVGPPAPAPIDRPAVAAVDRPAATVDPPPEPGRARTGPPGAPAGPRPARPPRPVTSFVGRQEELAALARLIQEHPVVTLVGPGGVGKTRLALELLSRWGDGPVAWVDLASVSDPADVPYRFLDALGLPEPADAPVDDFLADALCGGTCLTAVDNCEHVIEAAAGLLEKITMRAAGVALVATSREPLGIAGERVVVVPPLPTPERIGGDGAVLAPSVSLFLDRYRAAGGPALGPGALELVAEVCRRLDGLPLAVELAAARARSLGVAAMAERPLLDLLTGGRRGGAPRHRSLRAVLDWSHDLLDPHERVLLRRLSVFRGPFTLADAEAVCAGGGLAPDRVPAALAALVERSMVAGPGPEGDYRLLETVRAYGAEQLAAHGEDLRTGAAHARYLVEFAEQAAAGMRTADEPVWVGLVSARVEELRGAFRWACDHDADLAVRLAAALTTYARLQMRFEMQDWAATAADLPGAAGHPLLPVVLASAAAAAWARGDFARAEHLARRGLEEAHDGPTAAAPLLILGDVALLAGRFADADRAYQQAARRCGDADPHLRTEVLGGRAAIAGYQGDVARARRLSRACLAETVDAPPGVRALALYFAAESQLTSDPEAALAMLEESRRLAAEIDARLLVGFATVSLVSLRARAASDPREGLAAYREVIEHWRRVGNRTQQWVTLRNLVPELVRAGEDELACLVHAAVRRAPVRVPEDVPEAEALAAAVGQAQARLPDGGRSAADLGARMALEDLLTRVLAAIAPPAGPDAGSGEVEPVEPPQVVLDR